MHDIIKMCSFEGTKSTKGASKMRRDLLNAEISQLRDLLPLPPSTRQRLSQLQLMALVCVFVRKSNYFNQAMKHSGGSRPDGPNLEFLKALSGFLMMLTQGGKLLYISDNAAEYLGHSMEDLLIHGDSVYDIIDKQDHAAVQAELVAGHSAHSQSDHHRLFLCRMNVSRNARRQMRFGDQKVVLVAGHYLSYLPLCSRNEPVFLAHCTPVAMPETRESVVQGATHVFTSVHTLDMRFISIDRNGEFHLGYNRGSLAGVSWYHLIHPDNMKEAQTKHRLITSSEQDRSCILLVRLQAAGGTWRWVHCVLQVKEATDSTSSSSSSSSNSDSQPVLTQVTSQVNNSTSNPSTATSSTSNTTSTPSATGTSTTGSSSSSSSSTQQQQPVIIATNQVLGEKEAAVLRANPWLYHYYTMQSKLQYGLHYDAQRLHAYYPQVMAYQGDSSGGYVSNTPLATGYHQSYTPTPTTPTSSHHHHHHTHPAAHHYPLATPGTYSHLPHYHHHPYSVRLDYPREATWGYYDPSAPHTEPQTPLPAHHHQHPPAHTPSPVHRPSKKSSSPLNSPRRSPQGGCEGGGVAVAAPVPVRAGPPVHKGAASPDLDQWKASPPQEVPEYGELSAYVTPPYSAATPTPTRLHVFAFDSPDPRDAPRDHHVPQGPPDHWGAHAFVR